MMDYIIAIGFIIGMAGMISTSIWQTKKNCKEQRMHSQVIYMLFKEVKRYNNNTFSGVDES